MATMCLNNEVLGAHDSGSIELPPGFRFHPTDEELVSFYLTRKINNIVFSVKAIVDVDLNRVEPWDLPEKAMVGEKEWYFFSLRDRKYPTGMRTNRATEMGYWKATGKDRDVMSSRNHTLVGMKKTLVFYRGRAPKGEKTNWIMHEYRVESDPINHVNQQPLRSKQDEWVVCRIFQKSSCSKKSFLYRDDMRSLNYRVNSSLPGYSQHSPTNAGSDEGDSDTCTVNESSYNRHDQLQDDGMMNNRELPWVIRTKSGAPDMVPIGTPLDISNMMKYPFYDPSPNMMKYNSLPAQGFANMKPYDHDGMRMQPKMEPYNNCGGEDEAQSGQNGRLDHMWAYENVLYQEISGGGLIPLQSLTGGTDQSSCITENICDEPQTGLPFRLRGYNGLPEMPGAMENIPECLTWAC